MTRRRRQKPAPLPPGHYNMTIDSVRKVRGKDLLRMKMTIGCPNPRVESDEFVCPGCALRWDTHEDKPKCLKGLDDGANNS